MKTYENILVEQRGKVGLVRLNRPRAMNALNNALLVELMGALEDFDTAEGVGAMVIAGNERAFAAGADIAEMADAGPVEMLLRDQIAQFDRMRGLHKPVVA